MQDIIDAYPELAALIAKEVPEVKWIDMWHDQLDEAMQNENGEYPFPFPAVFIQLGVNNMGTIGENAQGMNARFSFVLACDGLADTYHGSINQESALEFNVIAKKLHNKLQGKSGDNFSNLDRIGINRIPSHPTLVVYAQDYASELIDYGAQKGFDQAVITNITTQPGEAPVNIQTPLFQI